MTHRQIAEFCHNINTAYCHAIGDHSAVPWDKAPEWQQDSAIKGVKYAIDNLHTSTPQSQHEAWMKDKIEAGWVYGEVKDAEKKTHPSLLPYDMLPMEQKVKDYLFRQVIKSMLHLDHDLDYSGKTPDLSKLAAAVEENQKDAVLGGGVPDTGSAEQAG